MGPRQVGKTTLAQQFIDFSSPHYFDLEDPVSRQRLADPMNTLAGLDGLVVIVELQHLPALPEALRVLMDRPERMHQNGQYLDYLTQTYMVRQLQPWHENLSKRQVKAPKIYFRDTGLLHALLGIRSLPQLLTHPLSGASWEGFALEQVLRIAQPDQAYFWATHQGAELDLLLFKDQRRIGVEFKRSDAPKLTPGMRIALEDLKLDALYVVYPGPHRYTLAPQVEAVPLTALLA